MPKLKTNKGVAKRFKISKRGKVMRHKAGKRHLATGKSRKRKRHSRKVSGLAGRGPRLIKRLMPYG